MCRAQQRPGWTGRLGGLSRAPPCRPRLPTMVQDCGGSSFPPSVLVFGASGTCGSVGKQQRVPWSFAEALSSGAAGRKWSWTVNCTVQRPTSALQPITRSRSLKVVLSYSRGLRLRDWRACIRSL